MHQHLKSEACELINLMQSILHPQHRSFAGKILRILRDSQAKSHHGKSQQAGNASILPTCQR